MQDIIIKAKRFNSNVSYAGLILPDGFDEPSMADNYRFDSPHKIGDIDLKDAFDDRAFAKKGFHKIAIKRPSETFCRLPKGLSQFREFVQKATDYDAQHSPLFPFKRAVLVVRAFDGYREQPEQPMHFDPYLEKPDGRIENLYSVANRLGTEYALNDNPGPSEIESVFDYDINMFSMRCLHRQPVISVRFTRVFAAVSFKLSEDELIEVEQKFGLSPRALAL